MNQIGNFFPNFWKTHVLNGTIHLVIDLFINELLFLKLFLTSIQEQLPN